MNLRPNVEFCYLLINTFLILYGDCVNEVISAQYLIVKSNHGKFVMTNPVPASQYQSITGEPQWPQVRQSKGPGFNPGLDRLRIFMV